MIPLINNVHRTNTRLDIPETSGNLRGSHRAITTETLCSCNALFIRILCHLYKIETKKTKNNNRFSSLSLFKYGYASPSLNQNKKKDKLCDTIPNNIIANPSLLKNIINEVLQAEDESMETLCLLLKQIDPQGNNQLINNIVNIMSKWSVKHPIETRNQLKSLMNTQKQKEKETKK